MNEETDTKLQIIHPSLFIFNVASTLPLLNEKAKKVGRTMVVPEYLLEVFMRDRCYFSFVLYS